MTTKTIKLIVFIAFLVHGIGHFQGVAAGMGVKINNTQPATSWILKNMSQQVNKTVCLILFFLTAVMGIITALSFKGILLPESLWQIPAIITAVLSTVCLVVFPNGFAMFFNKIGAVGVNLFIYYAILINQNWSSVLFDN